MRLPPVRSAKLLMGLLLLLWLTACGEISRAPRLYLLTPETRDHPVGDGHPPVAMLVVPVVVPHYLDRPQIVTRSRPNELELAEHDRWGDHFRRNLTRVLAENLSRLWPTEQVFIAPAQGEGAIDYRIEVTVDHFERGEDQRVRLTARFRLQETLHRFERLSPKVPDGDYPAIVAAMSGLTGDLAHAITQELRILTKRGSQSNPIRTTP